MVAHRSRNEVPARPEFTEQEYLAAAKAASTRAEYAKDLKYFIDGGGSIPATVDQVVAHITNMATWLAVATIEKRLVSLHLAHLEQGCRSPVHDPRIKELMKGVRRSVGVAQRQVKAIEKDILLDMWSAASKGQRNWAARTTALLAIGWAGAFRRSELVSLTWESVTWLESGIEILLASSKVDQTGVGFVKFIPLAYGDRCPVKALKHWQEVSGDSTGFIFRPVNRHDQIADKPLTPHAVALIVKGIIEQTGRDPKLFSGHSLRAGFVTAGTLAGIASHTLMQVTGHRSEVTLAKYVRIGIRRRIGEVWYDEMHSNRSELVVTVAGLPMFVETVYSSTNQSALSGCIELSGGSAVLTANRDGFTSAAREQFSKIVGNLVANQSAVRYGQALDLSLNFAAGIDLAARVPISSTSGGEASGESSAPLLLVCPEAAKPGVVDGYAAALGRITHERYPPNFHLKVESLSARRTAKSQAYITAPALVAEMNKQRSAKLAHSWRAALMTILCCDWALANGVAFHDIQGQLIDDWDSYGGEITDLQVYFRGRRVDAGFCFIANTEGLCSTPVDGKPLRIYINPLLLTAETGFRHGDTLDLAYHEISHLWEQHHGEGFCSVEGALRQSVRRWLSEKALLARLAYAQTL